MVEVTFEYVAPIAALLLISVSIWGAAKKFTAMDMAIQNNRKDFERDDAIGKNNIERIQKEIVDLRKDIREISIMLIKLKQEVEDKVK